MLYTDLNTEIDVGASAHHVRFGPLNALVDCGMHPKLMGYPALPKLDLLGRGTLDIIAITHAHLDHCGALPLVAQDNPNANILVGEGSGELIVRMLRNSRSVMGKQKAEYGIKEYPLYEYSAIDSISRRMETMTNSYERSFGENGDLKISFYPAGHVFGASGVLMEYKQRKVFFTGDMCFHSTTMIRGADFPKCKLDTLVVETTRGSYDRPEGQTRQSEAKRFMESLAKIIAEGGSVLVPCFALGRTQEVFNLIHIAKAAGMIPWKCPVYSSGLGLDIAETLAETTRKYTQFHFGKSCLEGVVPLREEIIPGRDFDNKGIYVLGSGMMTPNTPSYAAAAALIEHKANAIYFVGYADPDTPAARLVSCPKNADFAFPELSYVGKANCRVGKFDLSSHADRSEVLRFILERDPRCVVLTHGSYESREWFMYEIMEISPKTQVIIPEPGEEIEI